MENSPTLSPALPSALAPEAAETDPTDRLDPQALQHALAQAPGWAAGNAYERTKRCCEWLTRAGRRLPSWMVLREIIGKGSSGDINRGKEDFRREHAAALRKMDGAVDGVPAELAPHIAGFWTAALVQARETFNGQAAQWQAHIERCESAVEQADADRAAAREQGALLAERVEGLQQALASAQQRADGECAAREQAERMFETQAAEVHAQRERLEAALKDSKVEMGQLIERFDAERRYAMLQIEEARTKAASEIAVLKERAQHEQAALELDVARLNRTVAEWRGKNAEADREAVRLRQEAEGLRQRVARVEAAAAAAAENPVLTSRRARQRQQPLRAGAVRMRRTASKLSSNAERRSLR